MNQTQITLQQLALMLINRNVALVDLKKHGWELRKNKGFFDMRNAVTAAIKKRPLKAEDQVSALELLLKRIVKPYREKSL